MVIFINMVFTTVARTFSGGFFGLGVGVTWQDIYMERLLMVKENPNEGGAGFSSII